jgi:predicted DNA-binding transcriptional regulator AlpA
MCNSFENTEAFMTTTVTVSTGVYDKPALAIRLQRSVQSLQRDDHAGRIPRGFRIGRSRRWLISEIEDWLAAGAPPRDEWESMKRQNRRA